jgi:hypothetical protein
LDIRSGSILRQVFFNECKGNDIVTASRFFRKAGVIYPEKDGVITCYKIADERVSKIIKLLFA